VLDILFDQIKSIKSCDTEFDDNNNIRETKEVLHILLDKVGKYPFDLFKIRLDHMLVPMANYDVQVFAEFLDHRSQALDYLSTINSGLCNHSKVSILASNNLMTISDA